jgi:hypothetical protein
MLATMLPSHADNGVVMATWPRRDEGTESCWRRRIVKSIEVLLHRKEVRYSCVACSRVIAGKYHNLGTSLYDKNLTLLNVSTKGFAHKLART